jgi:hypothetical protein
VTTPNSLLTPSSLYWRVAFEAAWDYATFYQRRYRVAKADGRWWVTPA